MPTKYEKYNVPVHNEMLFEFKNQKPVKMLMIQQKYYACIYVRTCTLS